MKMVYETRKILGDDSIRISATCVRIPVANCHSECITVETERPVSPEEARRLFSAFPGLRVLDDTPNGTYPLPVAVLGQRRHVHRPHPPRPLASQRPQLLVRERQPPQRGGDERRADRRVAGQTPNGKGRLRSKSGRGRAAATSSITAGVRSILRFVRRKSRTMNGFPFRDGQFYCEDVPLRRLADEFGTPALGLLEELARRPLPRDPAGLRPGRAGHLLFGQGQRATCRS